MPFSQELPLWLKTGTKPPDTMLNTTGWQPGDKPPADWLNYLANRTYLALDELQKNAVHKEDNAGMAQHLSDMTKHNQFMLDGKLHQLGFGFNSTLGCVTWSIREVATQ